MQGGHQEAANVRLAGNDDNGKYSEKKEKKPSLGPEHRTRDK